jgi:predicted SnoaL-like aldol condensation-catalyzing enzyme
MVLLILVVGLSVSLTDSDKLAENKAMVHRVAEEVFSEGNLDVVDELYAANFVQHGPDGEVNGPEGVKQVVTMYRTAFPDVHVTVEDLIAEGK